MGQQNTSMPHLGPLVAPPMSGSLGSTSFPDGPILDAAARVPHLLQWRRFEDVHAVLNSLLHHLERVNINEIDPLILRAIVLPVLGALPHLQWWPQQQRQLASVATGLAASALAKSSSRLADSTSRGLTTARLRAHGLWIAEAIKLVTIAWSPDSFLVKQTMDANRFVLHLCAAAMRWPLGSPGYAAAARHVTPAAELVSRCTSCPEAGLWTSRFFASHLQAVIPAFEVLAGSHTASRTISGTAPAQSQELTGGGSARMAQVLVRESHQGALTSKSLDRALHFLRAWEERQRPGNGATAAHVAAHTASVFLQAAACLDGMHEGASLTVAACFIAYFLGNAGAVHEPLPLLWRRRVLRSVVDEEEGKEIRDERLAAWLRGGLRHAATSQESLVLNGYTAAVAATRLAEKQSPDWWGTFAECVWRMLCDVVLPAWLLKSGWRELEGHRESAICVALPSYAEAFATCLSSLPADAQTRLLMQPLEMLCRDWSDCWAAQSSQDEREPVRGWFCSLLFLFVGVVARRSCAAASSGPTGVGATSLLHCLRSMAYVDVFRMDTMEYRAVCVSLVDQGTSIGSAGFVKGLIWTLQEFYDPTKDGNECSRHQISRLYFFLGLLASSTCLDLAAPFLSSIWSVVLGCLPRSAASTDEYDSLALALRAHALAGIFIDHFGIADEANARAARDYLLAGIDVVTRAPNDEVIGSFLGATEILAKQIALQCGRDEMVFTDVAQGRARELQRWVLQMLATRIIEACEDDVKEEAADGLFKLLCAVALHVDVRLMPEPLYTDCALLDILSKRPSFRTMWSWTVVAHMPEKAREVLSMRLIADFPDSTGAYEGDVGESATASVGMSSARDQLLRPFRRLRGLSAL